MTTKDLVFVANIILDCEERLRDKNEPLLDFIQEQCRKYKVTEVQDLIIAIAGRVTHIYTIGTVSMDYSDKEYI